MAEETPRDDEPTAGLPGEPVDVPAESEDAPPAEQPLDEPAGETTVGDEPAEPITEEPAPEAAAETQHDAEAADDEEGEETPACPSRPSTPRTHPPSAPPSAPAASRAR